MIDFDIACIPFIHFDIVFMNSFPCFHYFSFVLWWKWWHDRDTETTYGSLISAIRLERIRSVYCRTTIDCLFSHHEFASNSYSSGWRTINIISISVEWMNGTNIIIIVIISNTKINQYAQAHFVETLRKILYTVSPHVRTIRRAWNQMCICDGGHGHSGKNLLFSV